MYEIFKNYGYGTIAYLRLIHTLIYVFAVISVIMLPTIAIYSSGDGFRGKVPEELEAFLVPTMGNLGHLEPVC
jgi:hypothetical protein